MTVFEKRSSLTVAAPIVQFAEGALEAAGRDVDEFWEGVSGIIDELTPENERLLAVRDALQAQIDGYHRANPGRPDPVKYRAFLIEIGYIQPVPESFDIEVRDVATEIARMAGPQLVVPLLNARFALNAVNARWGSLYDALYGTDAIACHGDPDPRAEYDPVRGAAVVAYGRRFLDSVAPLTTGSHGDVVVYGLAAGMLKVEMEDGKNAALIRPSTLVGYRGSADEPSALLLKHHGMHVEIVIDRSGSIGSSDAAGVQDIVLESALTTIMDLEDSVAAVDAEDKALGYRNWRGLMERTLTAQVVKRGRSLARSMNADRHYVGRDGAELILPGRSVLLIRNVGHLMRTPALRDAAGRDVYEGILDAIMTTLGALSDLQGARSGENSRTRSLYIVKPKMHGPEEVKFTVRLFERVEQLLGLPITTLKIGIMDEERRTSANLASCIWAARERLIFINTGFLDRTGDEIHTSMHAGPMLPKQVMKSRRWLNAYESRNVATGLACGLDGRAQIGKGMWAMPDLMNEMLAQKVGQIRAGASTAWVPSPQAATLHALNYHEVDAFAERRSLPPLSDDSLDALLEIPLATAEELTPDVVRAETLNNVQSILGYVARWIDQGVGCSKVLDIHDVALMEDRATLRISSQLLANWLAHGVVTRADIDDALRECAAVVDRQNAADSGYQSLLSNDSVAFEASRRLILEGAAQPNGYTEPLLHALRIRKKTEHPREQPHAGRRAG